MSTNNPVIAIGLDGADPTLIEKWIKAGELPALASVAEQGSYSRLVNKVNYSTIGDVDFSLTEPLWTMFLTGCLPDKTGFWDTVAYYPENYHVICDPIYGGYDYHEYLPFYAFADKQRIVAFDVPVCRAVPNIDGIQITGWGGHHPFTPSESIPASVLPELVARHGENPVYRKDNGYWWSRDYFNWVRQAVKDSLETRVKIFNDLMDQGPWDLFLTAFGETHTLGHDLYHMSDPQHPLYPHFNQIDTLGDPLLEGFKQVDAAVGALLDRTPDNANVAIFSLHGMDVNHTDMFSMMFLGEIMYRFNFPGKYGLTPGNIDEPPGPVIHRNIRNGWPGEVWRQMDEPNPLKKLWNTWMPKQFVADEKDGIVSPYQLQREGNEGYHWPAMGYCKLWPQMKAFAIPAFSDGHIRINLKGRDPQGIVELDEYDGLCQEITDMLYRLRDGRTQQPLVKQVVRTRTHPLDEDAKLPDSDLLVVWHEIFTDVIDSPDIKRIGPITYNRSGGHRNRGFLMLKGPGIDADAIRPNGRCVDVGATILDLMNVEAPEYFDGRSLLKHVAASPALI